MHFRRDLRTERHARAGQGASETDGNQPIGADLLREIAPREVVFDERPIMVGEASTDRGKRDSHRAPPPAPGKHDGDQHHGSDRQASGQALRIGGRFAVMG